MEIRFCASIHNVDQPQWDALTDSDYPFTRHAFLAALEDSQSCSHKSGWQSHHLTLWDKEQLLAAMPLYIKSHSYGEYVFDWSWADAYHQHQHEYYPKFVTCIPFTPATGPRVLSRVPFETILPEIIEAIKEESLRLGVSGWHCLFPVDELSDSLKQLNLGKRYGSQFHWFNRNYTSFDDFLEGFSSRKRKNLKKERLKVQEQGIQLKTKTGSDISSEEWALFYQLYHRTYFKRSGRQGYLTADFFTRLAKNLSEQVLMIIAEKEGKQIAMALCFRDSNTLYGRYWGCSDEYDFLHFETCYYQGIEYCIREGLNRFDPGAQGEHKIQRGFEPVLTWSNHWIAQEDFRQAINHFLEREKGGVLNYIKEAKSYLPFKKQQ